MHTKNDSANLPKINFIINFFLEILHFKEYCNLIEQQYFGSLLENQNFARYGIGAEISVTILVFILDYYQEKPMTKFFKNSKETYFGIILDHLPKFGQKGIFWKKGSVSF